MRLMIPVIFLLLYALPCAATEQANPNRLKVAKGDKIPLVEGYWATPPAACGRLKLSDPKRLPVGASFGLHEGMTFEPDDEFVYFSQRMGNWPDGACAITRIRKVSPKRYVLKGYCGEESRGIRATLDLVSERRLTQSGYYTPNGPKEFALCLAAP